MDARTQGIIRSATDQHGLVAARDVERVGLDGLGLRRAAATGGLVRVERGVYTHPEAWDALDAAGRYRLRVLAAARRLRRPVFSHDAAAALWRLPRIGPWPGQVHVLVPHATGPGSSAVVLRHGVAAVPDHLAVVDGVRVTGVARTVLDLARTWDLPAALAAADHALRAGWVTPNTLRDELASAGCGRGVGRARVVLAAASGASESVGESLSRARMIEIGLPAPVLQHDVRDDAGLIGRVDFWWEHLGLVGEFDGRLKYRVGEVGDRRAVEDRLWQEKVREDRLRAAGLRVVRWTWDTALDRERLARLLASAGLRP